ncbi:MAG: DegT/DnrJ/EryC1/StrS family aminotransferase, partial [bacterium]|nr:DegT/DnrJ/EryC1/StrS family aminotransferase [bacterium]
NWISSKGSYILRFEDEFRKFCDVKYGIATSNGTTVLYLALCMLGIGREDEVSIPALTFIATANAVVYTGAEKEDIEIIVNSLRKISRL